MRGPTDLSVVFELARTHAPQDPYAFRFEPQTYTLRTEGGGREVLEIEWSAELAVSLAGTPGVDERERADARFVLARALWPDPAERARARALAEQARDGYATLGEDHPGVEEVRAWLAVR